MEKNHLRERERESRRGKTHTYFTLTGECAAFPVSVLSVLGLKVAVLCKCGCDAIFRFDRDMENVV